MLEVRDIFFSYRNKAVLNGLTLNVEKGECIGIVGANGCGKSTLLAIMSGALKPISGSLCYDGKNPCKNHSVFSNYIGYVPQENPLLEELSVLDNLRLWYGKSKQELLSELQSGLLSSLNLSPSLNIPIYKLSGGMKKRVSIALSLLNNPPALILDEPGAALDLPCKEDIHNYLELYLKQGGTVMIATHEESELSLCSCLYVLRDGILHSIPPSLRGTDLLKQL